MPHRLMPTLWTLTLLAACGPTEGEQGGHLAGGSGRGLATRTGQSPAHRHQLRAWDQLARALEAGTGEAIWGLAPVPTPVPTTETEGVGLGLPDAGNELLVIFGDSQDLCQRLSSSQTATGPAATGQVANSVFGLASDAPGAQLAVWIREVDLAGELVVPGTGGVDVDPTVNLPWAMTVPGLHARAHLFTAGPASPAPAATTRAGCRPCAAAAAAAAAARPITPLPTGRLTLGARLQHGDRDGVDDSASPGLEVRLDLFPLGSDRHSFSTSLVATWCPALSRGLSWPPSSNPSATP